MTIPGSTAEDRVRLLVGAGVLGVYCALLVLLYWPQGRYWLRYYVRWPVWAVRRGWHWLWHEPVAVPAWVKGPYVDLENERKV